MIRVALVWLALFSGVALAASPSCTLFSVRVDIGSDPDVFLSGIGRDAACAAGISTVVSRAIVIGAGAGASATVTTVTTSGGSFGVGQCSYQVKRSNGTNYGSYTQALRNDGAVACSSECSGVANLVAEGGGAGAWSGANLCRTEDADGNSIDGAGCRVVRAGPGINMSGGWFGQVRFTGASCSWSGETEVDSDPADCVTGPRGQVCLPTPKEGQSCGTFNGERVCFDKVPDSGCVLLREGGAVCDGAVGPKDEEGDPLPADAVVEDVQTGGTTNYNYYGPSTMGESASPVAGTGSSSDTGADDRTPPEMDDEAADYGAGPDDEWDAAAGMGGAISGLGASSWFGVFSGSAAALSGSSDCPSVQMDIEFMDASFDLLESACGYMAPHYSLWTTLMQVAWGLFALRLFFSGGRD